MGRRRFNQQEPPVQQSTSSEPQFKHFALQEKQQAVQNARDLFKYSKNKPLLETSKFDNSERNCKICGIAESADHKSSLTHRFNFKLFEWANYRKKLCKNRNGIEVEIKPNHYRQDSVEYTENRRMGSHKIRATVVEANARDNKFVFKVKITNVEKTKGILLTSAKLLHPLEYFYIEDLFKQLGDDNALDLAPGASYYFNIVFKLNLTLLGDNKMQIAMQFQNEDNHQFTITRQVVVIIADELKAKELKLKSVYTGVEIEERNNNVIPPVKYHNRVIYDVPQQDRNVLANGLDYSRRFTFEEIARMNQIKKDMLPNIPTKENYGKYFQYSLWMDEIESQNMIKRYNMAKIKMKCLKGKLLELHVEGLAEKRPSLVNGDLVNILVEEDRFIYQGIICRVENEHVHIKSVHDKLYNRINANPDLLLDVGFKVKRLPYERMHVAIVACAKKKDVLDCLFPEENLIKLERVAREDLYDHSLYNKDIANNAEQKLAVLNIMNGTSGQAPYIVFGPPGTGKTITIVEAILQIKIRKQNSRILVCAPANAACDMLTSKLIQYGCTKAELLRIHASTRDWSGVPDDIKAYSNYSDSGYYNLDITAMNKYRIIVTTLIMSGKFNQKYYPNYLFIDEAAQAMESEAAVAVALLGASKHIVLAGDPKQLGPICLSKSAIKFHLDISLLERLMDMPVYSENKPDFITMLKYNFRSHPNVLHVPNELFYNGSLKAVSDHIFRDPISNILIYPKIYPKGFTNLKYSGDNAATEFCSIIAKEKRTGSSPSYFNPQEIEMVIKYVTALMKLNEVTIKAEDIGVITPYIRQMHRIKQRLNEVKCGNVEVGTTEVFQGREKRVIIISTVRAQNSLLLHDQKYKLGFVKNAKRFNVALTRAKNKLIVIGCPNVLRYDINWLSYIDYCINNNTYFGEKLDRRDDLKQLNILKRFENVYTKDCC